MAFEPVLGQGYIWLGNKTPESDKWELAKRSHWLWEMLAKNVHEEGMDPLDELGWKKTGTVIVPVALLFFHGKFNFSHIFWWN